jgi:hypothetical protein
MVGSYSFSHQGLQPLRFHQYTISGVRFQPLRALPFLTYEYAVTFCLTGAKRLQKRCGLCHNEQAIKAGGTAAAMPVSCHARH